MMKRLLDIVVAATLLIVLSPVMIVVAVLVRIKLGSPVIFRQMRPGKDARPFLMLKFRSMLDARDAKGEVLPDSERLTSFGSLLRATSLDELPELWNVLKGDMSLVGPRPLLFKYLPFFRDDERVRFSVRPGVTGLAQVLGRNTARWDQRIAWDVQYSKSAGLLTDLGIVFKTFVKVIKRDGVVIDPRSIMLDLDDERKDIINFKIAESADSEILGCLFERGYNGDIFDFNIATSKKFGKFISDVLIERDKFLVIVRCGRIAGAIQIRDLGQTLHLNNIVVDASETGWGVSDLLIQEFHRMAGSRPTDLFVDLENQKALKFFARHGYREIRREEKAVVEIAHGHTASAQHQPSRLEPLDAGHIERYGFGFLRDTQSEIRIGFIAPDKMNVPPEADRELVQAAFSHLRSGKMVVSASQSTYVPSGARKTIRTILRMERKQA